MRYVAALIACLIMVGGATVAAIYCYDRGFSNWIVGGFIGVVILTLFSFWDLLSEAGKTSSE